MTCEKTALRDPAAASSGPPHPDGATTGGRGTARRRPSLLINAISNWAGLAVSMVVGFLLTPYVIARLGQSGYGIWTLVGSIIGYYGLLDMGVGSAVTRYVARYAGQKDEKALNETLAAAVTLFGGIGLAIVVLVSASTGLLASFFHVQPEQIPDFRCALLLLSVSTAINLLGQVFRATIRAYEHFVVRNCVAVAGTLLRAGLTVWLLSRGLGLVALACSYVVTEGVTLLIQVLTLRRLVPAARLNLRLARWAPARTLLIYGLSTTVVTMASIILYHLDSVVIGHIIDLEAVGVYGVAAVLMRYYDQLLFSATGVLTPRFARLQGEGGLDPFRKLLIGSIWMSSILSFGTGLLLVTVGESFIVVWVGPEYREAARVVIVLVTAAAFGLAQYPAVMALYATNNHYVLALARMIEAVFNLGLSIWLAYRMGMIGVALGTMIPSLILRVFVQPVYMTRILGLRLRSYAMPVLVTAGSALAAGVLGRMWFAADEISTLAGCVALGLKMSALYALCLLAVLCGPLRAQVRRLWSSRHGTPRADTSGVLAVVETDR